VVAYSEATNSFDLARLLGAFSEDAFVNDQVQHGWGKPAITKYAKRDLIGERLTMNVTKAIDQYGNFIVTANVDGNHHFDQRTSSNWGSVWSRCVAQNARSRRHD
jgi:hypothetical protein